MYPRLGNRMLPDGGLSLARDVNLERGYIQAWNCPDVLCPTDEPPLTIIDGELCCTSPELIYVTRYTNSGCEYMIRNRRGVLSIGSPAEACADEWCPLTPSCPSNKPGIEAGPGELCDPQPVAYRYTYVNVYGFEGAPSKATSMILDGHSQAILSNLELPPPGECIEFMRIYRLDDSVRTEGVIDDGAEWLLIAEIDPTTDFEDTTGFYSTSIPLNTWGAFPAPSDIKGLDAMSNGALVGYSGRILYFSDPTDLAPRPHSWSGDYDLELPDEIRGIVVNGDVLYVATDRYPYVVAPQFAGPELVYTYQALNVLAPLKTERSLHATPSGAAYVSDLGMIQFNQGSATVITDSYFTQEQWRDANIVNSISVGGRTFLLGDTSYVLFNNSGVHNHASELSPLTELTLLGNPADMAIDSNGDIIFTTEAGLSRFQFSSDNGTEKCPYEIKSRVINFAGGVNLAAAKIQSDGPVEFTLTAIHCDQKRDIITRMTPCCPFRLPSQFLATDYCYTLTGTADIYSVSLGRSMSELSAP